MTDISQKIRYELGLAAATSAETVAATAFENYKGYAAGKQEYLNAVRAVLVWIYADLVNEYTAIGYSRKQAMAECKSTATKLKELLLGLVDEKYPSSGKKVEQVF